MSPEDALIAALDADRAAIREGEPELVLISHAGNLKPHAVILTGKNVRPWELGSAVLTSLASWALPNEPVRVTVQLLFPSRAGVANCVMLKVELGPANVAGFDLQAAYREFRDKPTSVTAQPSRRNGEI